MISSLVPPSSSGAAARAPGREGLDQAAVGQAQFGPGRIDRKAGSQRVARRVRGDRRRQPLAQPLPVRRVGQPFPADGRRQVAQAHGRCRAGPQQPVPAQQVRRRRRLGPRCQLPLRGRGGAVAAQPRRRNVEHRRAEHRPAGGAVGGRAGIAEQHPVADVQRQRVVQAQPGGTAAQHPDPGHRARRADVQREPGRQPHGAGRLAGRPAGASAGRRSRWPPSSGRRG